MEYLKVRKWDVYQNYRKDRGNPPWIKLWRNLLRNPKWATLTEAERGQLVSIWLLAADRNGEIPDDPGLIQMFGMLKNKPDLKKFCDLGFLENGLPCGNQAVTTSPQGGKPEEIPLLPPRALHKADQEKDNELNQGDNHVVTSRLPHDRLEAEAEAEAEAKKRREDTLAQNFPEFWSLYPKKKSKGGAQKAWMKIKPDQDLSNRIIAKVNEGLKSEDWTKDNGKYVPYPATWLNRGGWEDEFKAVDNRFSETTRQNIETLNNWEPPEDTK